MGAPSAQEHEGRAGGHPHPLRGFPPHRAGALAGVSGNQIGHWARYDFIRPTVYEGPPANLYAFNDVAEAIVVHWLHANGFGYDEIHGAISMARREHPDWPLIRAPLAVARHGGGDDRGVIVQQLDDEYVEAGRPGEQLVIKPQLLDFGHDMLRRGGWLANELGLERIEVDPARLGGAPTVRGRRWPVERVARIAADGEGRSILTREYGLEDRDVDESLRWTEAAAAL